MTNIEHIIQFNNVYFMFLLELVHKNPNLEEIADTLTESEIIKKLSNPLDRKTNINDNFTMLNYNLLLTIYAKNEEFHKFIYSIISKNSDNLVYAGVEFNDYTLNLIKRAISLIFRPKFFLTLACAIKSTLIEKYQSISSINNTSTIRQIQSIQQQNQNSIFKFHNFDMNILGTLLKFPNTEFYLTIMHNVIAYSYILAYAYPEININDIFNSLDISTRELFIKQIRVLLEDCLKYDKNSFNPRLNHIKDCFEYLLYSNPNNAYILHTEKDIFEINKKYKFFDSLGI